MADVSTPPADIYPDLSEESSPPVEALLNDEEKMKAELAEELAKTEDEIATLKQVLISKEQHASELKKKLGITPLGQLKAELNKVQTSQAYQNTQAKVSELNEKLTSSEYYKKTSETLKSAGQATATAFNTIGSSVSTKFSEMKNSPTFKSFEEKMEGVGTTIMAKVSGTSKENSAANTPGEEGHPEGPVTHQPMPNNEAPM